MNPVIQIPESVHALLSPSKAHMWLACPGALAAAKDQPGRPPTKYAAEGTVYHDVARRALVEDKDCSAYIGDRYEVQGFPFTVDEQNAEYAQVYVDAIRAIPGKRMVEVDLEYSALLSVPRYVTLEATASEAQPVAAGTGDCVVIDYENKIIHSHDLKFGRGDIVYAKENPQLRLYGIAAVERYALLGIEDDWMVSMAIHQPRVQHFDSELITVGELRAWTEAQKPAANEAYTLYCSPHLLSPAHLNPGEKQCRWCPLSGSCVAQRDKMLALFPTGHAAKAIPLLTQLPAEELADALDRADEIEHWLSAVRAEGLARALQGHTLPRWKLVQGRRGNRALDTEAQVYLDVETLVAIGVDAEEPTKLPVEDALHFALGDAAYTKKIKTAAQLEKPLAKKVPTLWAALQAHITQAEGKPALEKMEDPRPPMPLTSPEFPVAPTDGNAPLV